MKITIADVWLFLKVLIIVLFFDGIYLHLMREFLMGQILEVQNTTKMRIRYSAVFLCYIVISFAIFYLVKTGHSAITGGITGFIIYSVYELTNYAVFTAWKPAMVIIDTLWGSFLFYITMSLSKIIA
jgi:uncharacterized membrane protein